MAGAVVAVGSGAGGSDGSDSAPTPSTPTPEQLCFEYNDEYAVLLEEELLLLRQQDIESPNDERDERICELSHEKADLIQKFLDNCDLTTENRMIFESVSDTFREC